MVNFVDCPRREKSLLSGGQGVVFLKGGILSEKGVSVSRGSSQEKKGGVLRRLRTSNKGGGGGKRERESEG